MTRITITRCAHGVNGVRVLPSKSFELRYRLRETRDYNAPEYGQAFRLRREARNVEAAQRALHTEVDAYAKAWLEKNPPTGTHLNEDSFEAACAAFNEDIKQPTLN